MLKPPKTLPLAVLALGFVQGLALHFTLKWAGLHWLAHGVAVLPLVLLLFVLEALGLGCCAPKDPWLNGLRLNGVLFGFGSVGLGMALLLLARV